MSKSLPDALTYEEYILIRKKSRYRKNDKAVGYSEQWEIEYKIKNGEGYWDDKIQMFCTKEKRMDEEVLIRFKEIMKEKGLVENVTYEINKIKYL